MKRKREARPPGEIRQSQIITTFGPGAMLDLPNHSVLVAGLDFWSRGGEEIIEPRLTQKLAQILDVPTLRLLTPPTEQEDPAAPSTGIDCFQFPEWFITQDVETGDPKSTSRSRMLVHRKALTRGRFIDRNRKKKAGGPGALRARLPEWAHWRHRLVQFRARRARRLCGQTSSVVDR
jgi:hypothetical protein